MADLTVAAELSWFSVFLRCKRMIYSPGGADIHALAEDHPCDGRGRLYELKQGATFLGREPTCTVRIDSRKVSKQHAQIEVREREARILDLGSTNGTRVGDRDATEPILLVDGDIIEVGDFQFLFVQEEPRILDSQDASQKRTTELAASNAERKLKALLSLAIAMGGTINLDEVLGHAHECLFSIFPSAERAFVLLEEAGQIKDRARRVSKLTKTPSRYSAGPFSRRLSRETWDCFALMRVPTPDSLMPQVCFHPAYGA